MGGCTGVVGAVRVRRWTGGGWEKQGRVGIR